MKDQENIDLEPLIAQEEFFSGQYRDDKTSRHAKMDTRRQFYTNADTMMKKKAIDKAASDINPIFSDEYDID